MEKRNMLELDRLSVEAYQNTKKTPLVVILDNIRSGLNVGSAFRTSDAFALEELILGGISVQPPHREILKTALGAHQSVNWRHFESSAEAVKEYQAKGYKVYAVEQVKGSLALQDFQWPSEQKLAIVFGNEVEGVSEEVLALVDGAIEIPQFGTKHSLNISVSFGIVVWELFRKHQGWS